MNKIILYILCKQINIYLAQKILDYKKKQEIIDAKKEYSNKFWKKFYYFRGKRKKSIRNFNVVVKKWYENCNRIENIKLNREILDYFYEKYYYYNYLIFFLKSSFCFYVSIIEHFRNYLLIGDLTYKKILLEKRKEILDENKEKSFYNSLQILYDVYKN